MRRRIAGAVLLVLSLSSCARPTAAEVDAELSKMIDPVLDASIADSNAISRVSGEDSCSDPFVGPRNGIRPGVEIRIPFELLGDDPDSLVIEAAKVWKDMGLRIKSDETEVAVIRFATGSGYSLNATVNHANQEARLTGTGPCVNDPQA